MSCNINKFQFNCKHEVINDDDLCVITVKADRSEEFYNTIKAIGIKRSEKLIDGKKWLDDVLAKKDTIPFVQQ
jgi:hypothetical protein